MSVPLKVPYLEARAIESAATELLRRYAKWKGTPPRPPIPIDDIVEGHLKLSLAVDDLRERLGNGDVLGATWLDEGHVVIDSSLEGNVGRFAFTLAHETGHWQLHRPIIEMEKVTVPLFARAPDEKATPAIVCRTSRRRDPAEWQADTFAACLLMPASDVRATVKAAFGDELPTTEGIEARRKAGEPDPWLRGVAEHVIETGNFENVSNEAMRYRLLDLKLVVDASNPQRKLL